MVNTKRIHKLLAVLSLAVSLPSPGQTAYELEVETTIAPVSEFVKLPLLAQELCNAARHQQNLPPHAAPWFRVHTSLSRSGP